MFENGAVNVFSVALTIAAVINIFYVAIRIWISLLRKSNRWEIIDHEAECDTYIVHDSSNQESDRLFCTLEAATDYVKHRLAH